jgi:hypothetical protein
MPELQVADGAHPDLPVPGRVRVDGCEGTTRRTVSREPPAVGHYAKGGGTDGAADAIENDGQARAACGRKHSVGPVWQPVVDGGARSSGSDHF